MLAMMTIAAVALMQFRHLAVTHVGPRSPVKLILTPWALFKSDGDQGFLNTIKGHTQRLDDER
jgi:hypothetical protein